ncbi:MAG: YeeE/YedE family protein, partial [Acidovorax sp.]
MSFSFRFPLATAWLALTLLAALVAVAQWLQGQAGGRTLVFALACGAVLGIVLQRSRFCFYCHARDWFEDRNPRGMLAIVLALAVGVVGYTVVLGSWLPVPQPGKLPPDMHIGPVSWVLLAAGLSFGAGMVVSGSCISAHWYRLAEGSVVSPFALVGSALGFILGFKSWNGLYSASVADAPVVWLPAHLGYGGALLVQLGVLALVAAWLWRGFAREAGGERAGRVPPLREVWRSLWTGRWHYWVGGLAVGLIGAFAIVRMRPLGVTATLGGAA